ncbi:MAG: hypothetical protein HY080_11290 [Gammaproteobacteria bacterium]|nr:hypothetical protein [Gammaproteobacteria bacterium]
MNYLDQLDQMLDANFRLVSIETYDPERVIDLFTQLSRFSNKAFYMWEDNAGLHRIGASHIKIPRTVIPKELLDHVDGCKHFGVFILRDFNKALGDEKTIQMLMRIAAGDVNKVVVLLSDFIDLPAALKPFTLRSKHQMRQTG